MVVVAAVTDIHKEGIEVKIFVIIINNNNNNMEET